MCDLCFFSLLLLLQPRNCQPNRRWFMKHKCPPSRLNSTGSYTGGTILWAEGRSGTETYYFGMKSVVDGGFSQCTSKEPFSDGYCRERLTTSALRSCVEQTGAPLIHVKPWHLLLPDSELRTPRHFFQVASSVDTLLKLPLEFIVSFNHRRARQQIFAKSSPCGGAINSPGC